MKVFPRLWVYLDMLVSILETYGYYPFAACKEVFMLSGVSILNFSDFRDLLSELRFMIGLQWLMGFGTKNSLLKKAGDV